jgi:hypothetical protein
MPQGIPRMAYVLLSHFGVIVAFCCSVAEIGRKRDFGGQEE